MQSCPTEFKTGHFLKAYSNNTLSLKEQFHIVFYFHKLNGIQYKLIMTALEEGKFYQLVAETTAFREQIFSKIGVVVEGDRLML